METILIAPVVLIIAALTSACLFGLGIALHDTLKWIVDSIKTYILWPIDEKFIEPIRVKIRHAKNAIKTKVRNMFAKLKTKPALIIISVISVITLYLWNTRYQVMPYNSNSVIIYDRWTGEVTRHFTRR